MPTHLFATHPKGMDDFYQQTMANEDEDFFIQLRLAHALMHSGQQTYLDAVQDFINCFLPEDTEALAVSELKHKKCCL